MRNAVVTSIVRLATFAALGTCVVAAIPACGGGGDPGPVGGGGGAGAAGGGGSAGRGGMAGGAGGGAAAGGTGGMSPAVGGGAGGGAGAGGSAGASGAGGAGGASGAGGGGGAAGAGGGAPDGAASDAAEPGPDVGGGEGDGGGAGGGPTPGADPGPGWMLRWSGTAATTGLETFEGQETSECSHGGVAHASVMGGRIRIDSHYPVDTDCNGRTDRARNEVKGMRAPGGGYVSMRRGETWLLRYDMFIPDTLDATTQFSHIYQIFAVAGTSAVTGPVVTMTLHSHDGTDSIELRIDGNSGPHFSPVPLAPIQNRWVTVEHEVKWDTAGSYRWSIKDGDRVHVNVTRASWNGWHGAERMRPKWGIYRNKGSAGLQTTHLLLDNFKAWQKQ
jgi:hypothetical protein